MLLDPLARARARTSDARRGSTRERLLDAAMQLFHEQGYHATGIHAVLRRANVSSGSLYHFFPTKEHLAAGVLDRYAAWMDGLLFAPVRAAAEDPVERVFLLLEGYRQQLVASDFRFGCPIGNLGLELAETHPVLREAIARNFRGWKEAVAECFDAMGDRLPAAVQPAALAATTLALMEGAVMQARVERSLESFDACVAQLRIHLELLTQRAE